MKRLLFFSLLVFFLSACGTVEDVSVDETDSEEESEEWLDNGCKAGEEYIAEEDTCILPIECDDYESCIDWSNELIASLEDLYGSLTEEESVMTDDDFLAHFYI